MTGEPATAVASALVGLPWVEAEERLRFLPVAYQTVLTRPPHRPVGTGELRVVGVRPRAADQWLVILAHRDYHPDRTVPPRDPPR